MSTPLNQLTTDAKTDMQNLGQIVNGSAAAPPVIVRSGIPIPTLASIAAAAAAAAASAGGSGSSSGTNGPFTTVILIDSVTGRNWGLTMDNGVLNWTQLN